MWVRLIQNWQAFGVGSIINCSEMCGKSLIAQGIAHPAANPDIVAPAQRETAVKPKYEQRGI